MPELTDQTLSPVAPTAPANADSALPRVGDILQRDGLLEPPPSEADGEAGDLTRQVPVTNAADESDLLAKNLNLMLDRIERLMKGL